MFDELRDGLQWQSEQIQMYGRTMQVPRLVSWYGHARAHYRYSGVDHAPKPWIPVLAAIRTRVEETTGIAFNAVLGNLYRDGNDAVAWHADDESELGPAPSIASLSFGATRRFDLRYKQDPKIRYTLDLTPGSLLLMHTGMQQHWQHCVPRQRQVDTARINLTFRVLPV